MSKKALSRYRIIQKREDSVASLCCDDPPHIFAEKPWARQIKVVADGFKHADFFSVQSLLISSSHIAQANSFSTASPGNDATRITNPGSTSTSCAAGLALLDPTER